MDKLSASRRRKVEELAAVLIAEEMSLRDLRNAPSPPVRDNPVSPGRSGRSILRFMTTLSTLSYDVFETAWGWFAVCGSEKGIRYATLPEPSPERALHDLEGMLRGALPEHVPGAFDAYHDQLNEYLSGERTAWDVTLDLEDVAPFFRRAWDACRSIPAGETRTYEWLAASAGNIKAVRAAGQAMARNRIPIVIPCHRVIGKDGGLHGFGGPGLPMKSRLLNLEAGNGA